MHFALAMDHHSTCPPSYNDPSYVVPQQEYKVPSSMLGWFRKSSKRSSPKSNRGSISNASSFTRSSTSTTCSSCSSVSAELSDAPPAYDELPTRIEPQPRASEDDRFTFLAKFDTVFLIDDSTSMIGENWRQTREALAAIAPICTKYDSDGIDVHFLNAIGSPWVDVQSASAVNSLFDRIKPRGATPTGQRLHGILQKYIATYQKTRGSAKPLNIIVITDGEATDDVDAPIVAAAKKLDKMDAPPWQIGIQFFQVGNSVSAREYLKYMDDNLTDRSGREIRDMVDTVPWQGDGGGNLNAEGILKVVLGAVNRRLDRKGVKLHQVRGFSRSY